MRSACDLVDAKYGAMGVLARTASISWSSCREGLTKEEHEAIGDLPSGHGVLSLLIREPRSAAT